MSPILGSNALRIILFWAGLTGRAAAGPIIAPGDIGLRHEVQLLADYGFISGPVNTSPLA